jgi:putative membrane protein
LQEDEMALRNGLGLLAAALVAAPLAVSAQGSAPTPPQPAQQQPAQQVQTGELLGTLHEINQNEIEAAKLAMEKARSPQVKAAAQTILQDHQQMDQQLTQLAQKKQITLQAPTSFTDKALDKAHQEQAMALEKLSGDKFDVAFISAQPFGHRFALAVIENGKQAPGLDPEMTQLLDQAQMKVQAHLDMAEQLLSRNVQVAQQPGGTQGG